MTTAGVRPRRGPRLVGEKIKSLYDPALDDAARREHVQAVAAAERRGLAEVLQRRVPPEAWQRLAGLLDEVTEILLPKNVRTQRVLLRHIIPTALPAVVVQATLGMAGAIIGEAALSFLGLGVQPPTPSWGTMLNGGRAHILDAPHLTVFPGLAIALLVLGFNFLGDGLRDRLDPRRRQVR